MEILRIPKHVGDTVVARLALSSDHSSRIRAVVKIERTMSAMMEHRECETVAQAEEWGIQIAQQGNAQLLIIEDRT